MLLLKLCSFSTIFLSAVAGFWNHAGFQANENVGSIYSINTYLDENYITSGKSTMHERSNLS